MTLYDKRRKKISEELKDKEYRDIFVEEKINIGIPFQIRALRGELTQQEFGELFEINQEEISRYENINYSRFTLSTLKKLARAFDVGLMVRFVSFGELIEHDLTLSSESLKALSYKDDPYFKEEEKTTVSSDEQFIRVHSPMTLDNVVSIEDHLSKATNESTNGGIDQKISIRI